MAGVWDDWYWFFKQNTTTNAGDVTSLINSGDGFTIFEAAAGTQGAGARAFRPTAASYETFPRGQCTLADTDPLSGGVEYYSAIYLPKDYLVSSVTFVSGATAADTPTHRIAGLRDSAGVKLAASADATTGAWAANSIKTHTFSSAFTTTYAGLHYVTLMMTATTDFPTLLGLSTLATGVGLAPKLTGSADSGLTTSIPSTGGTLTAIASRLYAYVA